MMCFVAVKLPNIHAICISLTPLKYYCAACRDTPPPIFSPLGY